MRWGVSPWPAVVVLLAASPLPACASSQPAPITRAAAPPFTEAPAIRFGDQWRYNSGVVSRVWINSEGRLHLQLGPGIPPMDFPLFVGKRWTATRHYGAVKTLHGSPPRVDIVDLSAEHIFEVVAFESVSTPAGVFDAYRIRWIQLTVGPEQSRAAMMMVWYSPAARGVVRRTTVTPTAPHRDLELREYRLAGDPR